ncbi:ASCH domain-containing protein [Nocardioides sp.]|uniref:ASCH domain-containing protein n=1 Tax=Nocardioides sp. TaxID=35761 RepID=UPI003565FE4F
MDDSEIENYWIRARSQSRLTQLPGYLPQNMVEMVLPPAWSFGGTPEQADELLALVLDGRKTATVSALRDYDGAEALPQVGALGIVLDGAGHPRALLETTEVSVVPFDQVPAEHALAEGEGDGSLASWRETQERFFAACEGGFAPDMPVVLERFRVLHRA